MVFAFNVDGRFQRAGFKLVAEVHGSVHHLQCVRQCSEEIWPAADLAVPVDPRTMRAAEPLPECHNCVGLARPKVLMFADTTWLPGRTKDSLGGWRPGGAACA